MSLLDFLIQARDLLIANWEPVATLATLLLILATYRRARLAWTKRHFLTRVNFSVNYVEGGFLRIRTLREVDITQVLLNNEHGIRMLMRAARRTTLQKPFLELPPNDAWIVLNAILNELSEQCATGFLARSMGAPAATGSYLFGITCEKDRSIRMNKLRVMVIEKSLLERIHELDYLEFEQPSHRVRYQTLNRMREIYLDEARRHNLMEVELAVG
jgi:hypothetical protein